MARKHPPDRLILSIDERRGAILDVIRKAKRNLVLPLFRSSLDFRREVAIVVDEPSAVTGAVELFRTLTAAAAEAGTHPAGAVDGAEW